MTLRLLFAILAVQDPGAAPPPVAEATVVVENPRAGTKAAGTLSLPAGEGPHPAVLLLSGSGPQDRDGTIHGHRPLKVLAEHLARRGIAVLRTDDRGVGESTGDFSVCTIEDFASDARAALAFLRTRREIDARRIGVVGASEGGLVAGLAAVDGGAAFVATLGTPGLRGDRFLVLQQEASMKAEGVAEAIVKARSKVMADALEAFRAGKDLDAAAASARSILAAGGMPVPMIESQIRMLRTPWARHRLSYDPAATLKKLKCPLLALNGSKDLQVPPKEHLGAIEAALKEAEHPDFKVQELPGLNHYLQTCETGIERESARLKEAISPAALEALSAWVLPRVKR